ncbi:hypothetical protein LCM08_13185 [Salipiger pacificus]|nr:hypothetical protein [Alloyangia pacifica]
MVSEFWQNALRWSGRHLPAVFAAFLSVLFVFLVAGLFIEEKSLLSRLVAPAAGFVGGAVIGGGLAATVGGIGVVAMGTGIGIPALAVAGLGAMVGGLLGGAGGFSFELISLMRNPSSFDVQYLGLFGVFIAAIALFFLLRSGLRFLLHRNA